MYPDYRYAVWIRDPDSDPVFILDPDPDPVILERLDLDYYCVTIVETLQKIPFERKNTLYSKGYKRNMNCK